MRTIALALITILLLVTAHSITLFAHDDEKAVTLGVEAAWARKTTPNAKTAAVYITAVNIGHHDAVIIKGAVSPVAEHITIHETIEENYVARMQEVDKITIKPGETIEFKPGGMHFMLFGLKKPLNEEDVFLVTLKTDKGKDIPVYVVVKDGLAF